MTIKPIVKPKSKKYLILTTTILLLTSCSDNPLTDAERGINTARNTKHEIVLKYLQCYALHPSDKSTCTNLLNDQYPNKWGKESHEYIDSYMYEAEKLGFRYFLTENLYLKHLYYDTNNSIFDRKCGTKTSARVHMIWT